MINWNINKISIFIILYLGLNWIYKYMIIHIIQYRLFSLSLSQMILRLI